MYTKLFILAVIAATQTATAQISIGPEAFPVPGDEGTFFSFEGTIDLGSTGSDQTWTFNNLSLGASETNTYISPQSSEFFENFPGATVAISEQTETGFLSVTDIAFEELGTASSDGTYLKYENPVRRAEFPIEEGDTFTDEFSGGYFDNGFEYGSIEGSIECTADGTGTVIVNNLTYFNCIRLHQVQTYTTDMGGFTSETTVNWYLWFAEGLKFPVVEYGIFEVTTNEGVSTFSGGAVTGANPPNVNVDSPEALESISIYPNPAHGELWVSGKTGDSYQLLDINGRVVLSGMLQGDLNKVVVDELSSGVYIFRLETENREVKNQKLIIE